MYYGGPSVPLQVNNCIILRTLRKIPKGFFNFRCTILRIGPCQTIFLITILYLDYLMGVLHMWITCEPITYFMLNRYDRMTTGIATQHLYDVCLRIIIKS